MFCCILQVVNLQAQLASLKEHASQSLVNGTTNANPNDRSNGKFPCYAQDVQSNWLQSENLGMMPQFNSNFMATNLESLQNGIMNMNTLGSYENSAPREENGSFSSFEETSYSMDSIDMQANYSRQWAFRDDIDHDLQSVAFGYMQQSWGNFWSLFGEDYITLSILYLILYVQLAFLRH